MLLDTKTSYNALEIPCAYKLDALVSPVATISDHIPNDESKYAFSPSTIAGSIARKSSPPALLCIWRIYKHQPSTLHVQLLDITSFKRNHHPRLPDDGTTKHFNAQLTFHQPILPSIASIHESNRTTIFLITSDGYLHLVQIPCTIREQPLSQLLSSPHAIQSIPLSAHFDRTGAPTSLCTINSSLCIGTANGSILHLSNMTTNLHVIELVPHSSGLLRNLTGMFGGFLGVPTAPAVSILTPISCAKRVVNSPNATTVTLLGSIHANSELRLWNPVNNQLVHSQALIPPESAIRYKAIIVRSTPDAYDPVTGLLLVYFEAIEASMTSTEVTTGTASASATGMDQTPTSEATHPSLHLHGGGTLCVYELFIEHRGDDAIKVLVENGPVLHGDTYRVHDIAVQCSADVEDERERKCINVWMMYEELGSQQRRVQCIPMRFRDEEAPPVYQVRTVENSITSPTLLHSADSSTTSTAPELQDDTERRSYVALDAVRRSLDAALERHTQWMVDGDASLQHAFTPSSGKSPGTFPESIPSLSLQKRKILRWPRCDSSIIDGVLSPGKYSYDLLKKTLSQIGALQGLGFRAEGANPPVAAASVEYGDLTSLIRRALTWTEQKGQGMPGGIFHAWNILLHTYAEMYHQEYKPIAFIHLMGTSSIMIIRQNELVSAVLPSSAAQSILAGALPSKWKSAMESETAEDRRDLFGAVVDIQYSFASYFGNAHVHSMLRTCLLHGLDFQLHIMPAIMDAITSRFDDKVLEERYLAMPVTLGGVLHSALDHAVCSDSDAFVDGFDDFIDWLALSVQPELSSSHSLAHPQHAQHAQDALLLSRDLMSLCLCALSFEATAQVDQWLVSSLFVYYLKSIGSLGQFHLSSTQHARLTTACASKVNAMLQRSMAVYWCTSAPRVYAQHTQRVAPSIMSAPEGEITPGVLRSAAPLAANTASESIGGLPVSHASIAPLEPSISMFVSLDIGERLDGSAAFKRARLTPAINAYAAEVIIDMLIEQYYHRDRDSQHGAPAPLSNNLLRRAAVLIPSAILSQSAASIPAAHQQPAAAVHQQRLSGLSQWSTKVLCSTIASSLLSSRNTSALVQFFRAMNFGDSPDVQMTFYVACCKVLSMGESARAVTDQRRLEVESAGLFFRVASIFSSHTTSGGNNNNDGGGGGGSWDGSLGVCATERNDLINHIKLHLESISKYLQARDTSGTALLKPGTPGNGNAMSIREAFDDLAYFETLMRIYEQLGCAWAASRCALCAAMYLEDSTMLSRSNATARVVLEEGKIDVDEKRRQRAGRLWSAVFTFCLQTGDYDEAYAAILANGVPELQVDGVHQLVKELCEKGELATLCALPFAQTSLVARSGTSYWTSMLDEAILALRRRATNLDIDTKPQPYKVLYDFQVSRGNYQAAAAAMLSYARRLTSEKPRDVAAAIEAQHALAIAVSALSLVEESQAYLEDSTSRKHIQGMDTTILTTSSFHADKIQDDGGRGGVLHAPTILTLSDLKKEHALMRARAAVVASSKADLWEGGAADDTLVQLLSLDLHDEAFALADAVCVGSRLQQARQRVVASLATRCAELQMAAYADCDESSGGAGGARGEKGGISNVPSLDMMTIDNTESTQRTNTTLPASIDRCRHDAGSDGGVLIHPHPLGHNNRSKNHNALLPAHATAKASQASATSAADASWQRLRKHLERYQQCGTECIGYRLYVVAVEHILRVHQCICPPPWLLSPFFPAPAVGPLATAAALHASAGDGSATGHESGRTATVRADIAGVLRVYMQYGRAEEAARLAVRYLRPYVETVPSMVFGKPAAVCLPHALLEELQSRLPSDVAVAQELSVMIGSLEQALMRQTEMLSDVFAS